MTEPEQIDVVSPTGFTESFDKIEDFKMGLSDLLQNNPDPRIVPIVWQVGFEHYVKGILMMSLDSKKAAKYLRYTEQIDVLKELDHLSENIADDLKKFYEIRNNYAHIININNERIKQLLDSMKINSSSNQNEISLNNAERVPLFCEELRKQLETIFQAIFNEKFDIIT